MAPPKRRTGGRVTPKGTKPGQLPRASAAPIGSSTSTRTSATAGVTPSSRYTPPVPRSVKESPRWLPVLMCVFFFIGIGAILARYLLSDSVGNWLVFAGLAFVLSGLYTATKWH
ncbi:MAG: hypothetical protein JWN62_2129 [Acidimicrobiales bacterium]|nr:hypothetical protein [Acidimicrobiales bacterium]